MPHKTHLISAQEDSLASASRHLATSEAAQTVEERADNRPTNLNPRQMQPAQILALQRTHGNQAVMRLLAKNGLIKPVAAHAPLIERELDNTVQRVWPFSKKAAPEQETGQAEPDPQPQVQVEQSEAEAEAPAIAQEHQYLQSLPSNTEFVTQAAVNGPTSESAEEAKPSLWKRIKNAVSPTYTVGKLGNTVGSNAATIAGASLKAAGPATALATGALDTGLGAYSTYSSSKKADKMDALADQAASQKSDLTLPLRYAAAQKSEKAFKRGIGTVGSALTTAGGVIGVLVAVGVMASNPVGWALLIAGGVIAGGLMLYRLGRKYLKANRGQVRREHARKLHQALVRGDALAVRAVQELGLNVKECSKPGGDRLIKKKLKSI